MREKIPYTLLITALYFLFPSILLGQSAEYFNDRLIVKYESENELQRIQTKQGINPKNAVRQILSQNGARTSQPLIPDRLQQTLRQRNLPSTDDVLRIREVTFSQRINPVRLAAKINSMPGVVYAEPRYIRQMDLRPNDPRIEKYVHEHNFFDAWDESQGSRDIVIAIVDGGVGYTNTDLDDNLWVNQDEVPVTLRPQVDGNNDGDITSTEIYDYLQDNGEDYNDDNTIDLDDALHNDSPFIDGIDGDNNNFTDDLYGWDFWDSGGIDSPVMTDNNPMHDATDHGTHVAGIAAAETDNDTAIAGASFNTTYMPVKAGGTTDESSLIGFGFEGILYAAQNGADIINCSWSGQSSSLAEEEIIDLAFEMGALVVASAGNENNERIDFPAGYDKVLSVGSIETNGFPSLYSNYGYQLDVLATGSDILSISYNNELVVKTGTSMSAPVVSGLAALIKDIHPNWSPERIGMQIRTSSSSLTVDYPDFYNNKLGGGSINAFEAVSTNNPGLKIISHDFVNEDGEKLTIGQPGTVQITLTNYGNSVSNVSLQLQSLSEAGIELDNPSRQIGSIATGDTVELSFDLTLTEDFDLEEIPTLRVDFANQSQNYEDYNVIQYDDILYDILAVNNVITSIGSDGTIGFTDPLASRGGVGFIPREPDGSGGYEEGDNLLFEGGLMIEINGEMYDAVREEDGVSRDFIPQELFSATSEDGEVTGHTRFITDADTGRQAAIDLQAYAFDQPGIRNVVFLEYTIQNPTEFVIMEDVYVGLFNDWDISNTPSNNNANYIEADSLLYLADAAESTQPVVSVAHLGPISSALAIDNAAQSRDSVFFGIYDGFTDGEKKGALKAGTERTTVQNTDVSAVTASGPYTIEPGASITVGFAYAFGGDVDQLRNQIAEARSRNLFSVSPTGRATPEEVPPQTTLYQNYPNPFNSSTQLRIDLEQSTEVTLTVFDVLGRKVRTLADREFEAGAHFLQFNADQLSSGTYFIRLITDHGVQSIPITLIK